MQYDYPNNLKPNENGYYLLNGSQLSKNINDFATIIAPKGTPLYTMTFGCAMTNVNKLNKGLSKDIAVYYYIHDTNWFIRTEEGLIKANDILNNEVIEEPLMQKIYNWLTEPIVIDKTPKDTNVLTGVATIELERNLFFITQETGWPGNYKKGYKLTRLSGIIIALTAIIIGFVIYKKKH